MTPASIAVLPRPRGTAVHLRSDRKIVVYNADGDQLSEHPVTGPSLDDQLPAGVLRCGAWIRTDIGHIAPVELP